MFKTISAALLAVSVIAAPAFAATTGTEQAPVIKATPVKASALNANAKLVGHHAKQVRHHLYRHHTKVGAIKTHSVSLKRVTHNATRRG
ncbi:MAG: hypothetical protein JOZ74_12250 [Bradyrhizobium sp.]|nr:hypothetical protein [Bradyrhizobium sp.]